MNKIKLMVLSVGLIFVGSKSFSQQWVKHGTGLSAANVIVADICLPNESCGWSIFAGFGQGVCGGSAPYFVRTINGVNWNGGAIPLPTDITPVCISALNKDTAWIAAGNIGTNTEGYIYKTVNGGLSWTQQSTATSNDVIRFVHFYDANYGVAVGDSSTFITSNGGNNWIYNGALPIPVAQIGTNLTTFLLNSYEVNGDIIWLGDVYGYFYKSNDKGTSWTLLPNGIQGSIKGIAFKDALHGMAVASRFVSGGSGGPGFDEDHSVSTSDGGLTWQPMPIQLNSMNVISDLAKYDVCYVPGTNNTFIVGSEYDVAASFSAITTDGGMTWALLDSTSQHTAVQFTNPTHGYTGGYIQDFVSGIFKWSGVLPNSTSTIHDNQSFNIFPNPANEYISVQSSLPKNFEHLKVQILDLTGRLCFTQEVEQAQLFKVDLRSLVDGQYVLKIQSGISTPFYYSFIHHQ